jgi:shikimate kinase
MTPSRTVFLTGFMGAGKTSVGAALARRMGCAFHDLDALIVERARQSVAEIFETSGEAGFRRLESEALAALLERLGDAPAVIALGGGTLEDAANLRAVRERGILVALEAPLETLLARTRRTPGTRPLALDEAGFCRLHARRQALYAAADVRVDSAAGDVEQVAARVQDSIETGMAHRRQK